MVKVSRRGGFSDRQGIKSENTEIQMKNFDNRTRIQIFNLLSEQYHFFYGGQYYSNDSVQSFFRYVTSEVFGQRIDTRKSIDDDKFFDEINQVIMNNSYDDVLTLVEAISEYWEQELNKKYPYKAYGYYLQEETYSVFKQFNELFKQEYVGYRFIDGLLSPISNEIEVDTIKETLDCEYSAVTLHISKAHSLLANREHPDYENSIKESISSVEAMCEIVTGVRGKEATLGNMLKKLEQKGVVIHSALKSAFNILYGYTSDANGIRHAGDIGGKASTFEEAKFMLISCCAFINYLKGIMAD
ncbi:AbiJ-NTD4 domain-containing protein [Sellimonas catena]|uniref:HEPN AbiJ-N-terminal domain-containing protein n=1 Tax=Sellimonas catena TaxID=2994035 RepID=A0A9W6FFJ9_9FIRM|nr:hypothetical protein [Sellimonas catena]GLG05711.1 hypothetical protein Selli1_28850 [Sellimonas catena]